MDFSNFENVNQSLPVVYDGDTAYITIDKDTVVECDNPIMIDRSVDKVIVRSSEAMTVRQLVLMPTEEMQPCIGPQTNTGMSFGRFSLSSYIYNTLAIIDMEVVCIPHKRNSAFALGTYGRRYVPKIDLVGHSSIQCPEISGKRYMIDNIQVYEGSTKLTGSADYIIANEGEDLSKYLTDKQKELKQKIGIRYPDIADMVTLEHSEQCLKALASIIEVKRPAKPEAWLNPANPNSGGFYMTLRTCEMIGMDYELAQTVEFCFENDKYRFFKNKYYGDRDLMNEKQYEPYVALIMNYVINGSLQDETIKSEVAYELIPTYFWSFVRGRSHREEAEEFVKAYLPADPATCDELAYCTDQDVLKFYQRV